MQDEFINIAAHELRTPIQPILGLSETLKSKIKDNEQLILIDVISKMQKDFADSQKIYLMLQELKANH